MSSISRTFLAERLKAAENLTTWVLTISYHCSYFSSLSQPRRLAKRSAQLPMATTGLGNRHRKSIAPTCTTLKPKRKTPMRVTSPKVS